VFRDLGYRSWEARALNSLGVLLATRGDLTAACRAWRSALAIFRSWACPRPQTWWRGWLSRNAGNLMRLANVLQTCPTHRSAAVIHGQPRSLPMPSDLQD
jgi:hypothetical protein